MMKKLAKLGLALLVIWLIFNCVATEPDLGTVELPPVACGGLCVLSLLIIGVMIGANVLYQQRR